ncbi:MAG: hypothetical protein OEY28_09995, partial [Nitrospira sp.]|nr:hypothetical protein [Nitrospira sp.]
PDGLVMSVSSSSNFMTSATFANNDSRGVSYGSSSYEATLMNAVAANSLYGFDINMQNGVFYNLAAVHQESIGVYLPSSTNLDNVFLGEILTGANASFDCWVLAAPSPGMDDDSNVLDVDTDSVHSGECHSQGGSDFVHVAAADLTNSFVGKLLADDLVNSNDVAGAAGTYPADPVAFDWVGFENPYRGWGIDGSAFPNIDNQSQWTTGAGRIWDWRLRDTDTQLRNKNALPTGAVALSQVWNGTPGTSDDAGCNLMVRGSKWDATNGVCRSAFLENAYEILNDRVGNDNNLCEAGETCLFTPNMASYQGHGNLVSAGQVSFDGGVVELVQYETNGVP